MEHLVRIALDDWYTFSENRQNNRYDAGQQQALQESNENLESFWPFVPITLKFCQYFIHQCTKNSAKRGVFPPDAGKHLALTFNPLTIILIGILLSS